MKNSILANVTDIKSFLPSDKTFTLVGGCFDLLHVGHLNILQYASTLEDLLVVAVLSDKNVSKYKNPERPIINQAQRVKMLASMKVVDFVYISDVNPNGYDTINLLKPNSVVFGKETNVDKINRWSNVIINCSPDTKITLFPRYAEEEISTSHIIKKIREKYDKNNS